MSYESINMDPCVGAGACTPVFRTLYGRCLDTGSTIGGTANVWAWMSAYDMNQIPWGWTRFATFNDSTKTSPDDIEDSHDGGHQYSRADLYTDPGIGLVSNISESYQSQIWLGGIQSYMVLAMGTEPSEAQISVVGCTFTLPSNPACVPNVIVNLPVPDATLGYKCNVYLCGAVGPNPLGLMNGIYPDLATYAAIVCPNYGASWDASQTCKDGTADPFRP